MKWITQIKDQGRACLSKLTISWNEIVTFFEHSSRTRDVRVRLGNVVRIAKRHLVTNVLTANEPLPTSYRTSVSRFDTVTHFVLKNILLSPTANFHGLNLPGSLVHDRFRYFHRFQSADSRPCIAPWLRFRDLVTQNRQQMPIKTKANRPKSERATSPPLKVCILNIFSLGKLLLSASSVLGMFSCF